MLEKPLTPEEYRLKYMAWSYDMQLLDLLLTCYCGHCVVCSIIRPSTIRMEYVTQGVGGSGLGTESPLEPWEAEEEYPEDEYYEGEEPLV